MEWNFKNGIPIYTQIIDEMTMRIASGQYKPGDKLESVRDLALDAGVRGHLPSLSEGDWFSPKGQAAGLSRRMRAY